MRTLVCQSFGTEDVPHPIRRCLDSAAAWARTLGFDHRFIGDEIFDRVPAGFRDAVGNQKLPMTDLARLLLAQGALNEGYDRYVWLDADVLVFAPEKLTVDAVTDYAFGREVWLRRGGRDRLSTTTGVHNAVCVFTKHNSNLNFYIYAIYEIARGLERPCLAHQFGPDFLNRFADVVGPRALTSVAMFSPVVTLDIANQGGRATRRMMRVHGAPIGAANLCGSFVGRESGGVTLTWDAMDRAIDRLCATRGQVVNRWVAGKGPV